MIPWYYMWSDRYRFFHEIFTDTMKQPEFSVRPIYLDQSVFDSTLHRGGSHTWSNSTLKVDKLIEVLESSEVPYVLFTDIDIICSSKEDIFSKLTPHMEARHSMVFLQEGSTLNIGFMLLMVCKEVIDFWKGIRDMVKTGGLDQDYVNQAIKTYSLPWGKFDRKFTCSNLWDGSPFAVLQTLSSSLGKEMDLAEKIYGFSVFIDVNPYLQYIPPTTLPYLREILKVMAKT
jgi:hypothetical protein